MLRKVHIDRFRRVETQLPRSSSAPIVDLLVAAVQATKVPLALDEHFAKHKQFFRPGDHSDLQENRSLLDDGAIGSFTATIFDRSSSEGEFKNRSSVGVVWQRPDALRRTWFPARTTLFETQGVPFNCWA